MWGRYRRDEEEERDRQWMGHICPVDLLMAMTATAFDCLLSGGNNKHVRTNIKSSRE